MAAGDPCDTPVLVLAGGLGTRLRPLTETVPKVLVPALGRPFVDHVLADAAAQGFVRFVLSVGYRADQVEAHLGDGSRWGYEVRYAREQRPLGTGGAIRHAANLLDDVFVLINGDTLLQVNLAGLLAHHLCATWAGLTIAAAHVPDRGRYGAMKVDDHGRVVGFDEKRPGAGPGWINGGVMAMDRAFLDGAPAGPFSLERDWLPRRLGRIAAFPTRGFFVDMGTHEVLATLDQELAAYLASSSGGG